MALPGVVGNMASFDPTVCRFSVYSARFRQYLLVNDIPAAKQVPVFITIIGDAHYQLLVDLFAPDDPTTKSLDDLLKKLEDHFEPATLEVAERHKFYGRRQREGESIAQFVADLKRLSLTCKFDTHLPSALRDQFIAGIRNDAMKRRLLTTEGITFETAIQTAQQSEAADRDMVSVLHGGASAISSGHTVAAVRPGKKPFRRSYQPVHSQNSGQKGTPGKNRNKAPCHRCGKTDHWAPDCPHKNDRCRTCGKIGHWAKVCRSQRSTTTRPVHHQSGELGAIFHSSPHVPADAIPISVLINGSPVHMELDTGATYSVLSEEHWKSIGAPRLSKTSIVLRSYGGRLLHVLGSFEPQVTVNGSIATVPLLVVRAPQFPSLFGRDWLGKFQLDWSSIFNSLRQCGLIHSVSLQDLTTRFPDLFSTELGHVTTVKAHIEMRPDVTLKFFKPRTVPFTLKAKIEAELDQLVKKGVIEPILRSDWAAPIVPVIKPDGSVRICGDFRLTINPSIQADWYPLPSTEDLFASLGTGTVFSKLDLSDAYLQIELEDSAKQYVVINTHRGLFRYNRLPFGVSFAPGLFQHTIDRATQGLEGVSCYLDDIIIHGATQEEHDQRLIALLARLREHGFRLKKSKCSISQSSLQYLGHMISAKGIQPTAEKVRAILQAPKPSNVTELRSFLGIVNYYSKFIPDLATMAAPLYALLQENVAWHWGKNCERSFQDLRRSITTDDVLIHYDSKLPLVLECDASSYGVGAVLSHVMCDGTQRPIAFASQALSASEKNYSQIEREASSLIFGVKKFHRYLFGRRFELVTDHKPLLIVLGPKGHIASVSASRLHRWAVVLSAYDFSLKFRPTQQHGNADYLSRSPLTSTTDSIDSDDYYQRISFLDDVTGAPITYQQVRKATLKDPLLTEVIRYVQSGWPFESHCPKDSLKPFFNRRHELTVSGNCLLWGLRLVIPNALQRNLLDSLHECHAGIVRMKAIARAYIWWPGIDAAIEEVAKACISCAQVQAHPPKAPLHPWAFPERPWQRVHVDFMGPLFNCQWLVLVDAYSKWPEVVAFSTPPTAASLIDSLRGIFARFGIPEEIVSDNGPQFTAELFKRFCTGAGIRHRLTAPYHPASNGEAERFVRSFKEGLKPFGNSTAWKTNVQRFLMSYRVTPHSTTNRSPSELLLGRTIRSTWDLLRPQCTDTVKDAQERQQRSLGKKDRPFTDGDQVWVRDYRGTQKWIPGKIVQQFGTRNYGIETSIGIWKRHVNQIRMRHIITTPDSGNATMDLPAGDIVITPPPVVRPASPVQIDTPISVATPPRTPVTDSTGSTPYSTPASSTATPTTPRITPRYPRRQHKPPDRFIPT